MNPRTLTEPTTDARLLDALAEIVGHTHVLTDSELIEGYTRDWTGRWIGDAIAVIRPGNTSEVSAVLRACFDAGFPSHRKAATPDWSVVGSPRLGPWC